jgi:hypothetical protein
MKNIKKRKMDTVMDMVARDMDILTVVMEKSMSMTMLFTQITLMRPRKGL